MHPHPFAPFLRWFLLLSGLFVSACGAPDEDRPDNLLDEDRMVDILIDVHLAETRVSRMGLSSSDSANVVYKRLENQLFKKHGVDTTTYQKSYIYYSSHPREMEVIYKRIVAKLQKQLETKKPARS